MLAGFEKGSGTEIVTETIRQVLHWRCRWKPSSTTAPHIFILSLDIRAAFDYMCHGLVPAALEKAGCPAASAWAICREWSEVSATASLAQLRPTRRFEYSRGGKQGAVETPEL